MRLAAILLVHDYNDAIGMLLSRLRADYDFVCVHVDAKVWASVRADYEAPAQFPNVEVISATHVEWGGWGVVEGTLAAMRRVLAAKIDADYVTLLSGSDYPIRPVGALKAFLAKRPIDYIEAKDIFGERWVVGGFQQERLFWWFPFDYRKNRRLFSTAAKLQKRLGYRRRRPAGFEFAIGSQFWTLRRATCEKALRLYDSRPDFARFFKHSWIPDETAIQTLVRTVVPPKEISQQSMTLYHFNEEGRPVHFFEEHVDLLRAQGFFFARKLSPSSLRLRALLDERAETSDGEENFSFGSKSDALRALGRQPAGAAIGRTAPPAFRGRPPRSGRRYLAIFASEQVDPDRIRDRFSAMAGHEYLGAVFASPRFDAPAWLLEPLGLGAEDVAVRNAFPDDILTQIIDACPQAPIIFLPQGASESLLDRVAADPYAERILILEPSGLRTRYFESMASKFRWFRSSFRLLDLTVDAAGIGLGEFSGANFAPPAQRFRRDA
jgi:hypothetical protein